MDNVTSNPVRDDDASIISVTRDQQDTNSDEQLANLAQNREARRRCVVHKVIAARALRYGSAPAGPRNKAFAGACELRSIETALQWRPNSVISTVGRYHSSADVIAATFQLQACAKSFLACLPNEGCEFHELWEMETVGAEKEGKAVRLGTWKEALERIVVNKQRGWKT
jgi:hypothetical protein